MTHTKRAQPRPAGNSRPCRDPEHSRYRRHDASDHAISPDPDPPSRDRQPSTLHAFQSGDYWPKSQCMLLLHSSGCFRKFSCPISHKLQAVCIAGRCEDSRAAVHARSSSFDWWQPFPCRSHGPATKLYCGWSLNQQCCSGGALLSLPLLSDKALADMETNRSVISVRGLSAFQRSAQRNYLAVCAMRMLLHNTWHPMLS